MDVMMCRLVMGDTLRHAPPSASVTRHGLWHGASAEKSARSPPTGATRERRAGGAGDVQRPGGEHGVVAVGDRALRAAHAASTVS